MQEKATDIGMNWPRLLCDRRTGQGPGSRAEQRSRFEQDYDRIIFSHPFRMLQDKTQVFPLPKHDFVHTRLTHSLEVASVGRSLGRLAGEEIIKKRPEIHEAGFSPTDFGAIVSAAALMHDMGNPPFGHAGESAISSFFANNECSSLIRSGVSDAQWADLTNFEGNAQGFRLANKQNSQGLRLTYATLGAFTKYPRPSLVRHVDKKRKSQKKYGFLQHDKNAFATMADEMGLIPLPNADENTWCRHPLAFMVEAADDICYNIVDLEDGTNLGLVSLEETKSLLAEIIGPAFSEDKYRRIASKKEKVSVLRAMAIQTLINQCVDKFVMEEDALLSGTFDGALTNHIPATGTLEKIQDLSIKKIYKSDPVMRREVAGFEVLHGLLETFVPAVLGALADEKTSWYHNSLTKLLPADLYEEMSGCDSVYEAMLVLLDFISGMTDSFALSLYRNIKGIALPG